MYDAKIVIAHHTHPIRIEVSIPFLILSYFPAPRFCPQKVAIVVPSTPNIIINSSDNLLAVVWASIISCPNALIALCNVTEPIDTRLLINPMEQPVDISLAVSEESILKSFLLIQSISYLLQLYIKQETRAINCDKTVATAAPRTPIGITFRNRISPPILSPTDIPRNISGVNESPIERRMAAQTL